MKEIISCVYVGDIADLDPEVLQENGITHVLSICPFVNVAGLPPSVTHQLTVAVEDLETSDLLSRLPECFRFIDKALESGSVLVHW